ncbi:MAG: sigma-70 family RNA polymerase sigma factor [Elusimicrobiota bacterium]
MNIISKAIEISKDYVESPLLNDKNTILSMNLPEEPNIDWYTTFFTVNDLQKTSKKVRRLSNKEEKALFLRYNLARKNIKQLYDLMKESNNKVSFRLAIKKWYNVAIECRQILTKYNLALVIFGMRSFLKAGLNFNDLLSEGNVALLNAINKFDVTTGNKFSTYATYAIRNALIKELNKYKKYYEQCPVSPDPSLGNGEDEEDNLVDKNRDDQKEYLIEILEDVLKDNTAQLSRVERQVVKMRYLDDYKKTYTEIGSAIGITGEWARQHNLTALAKLRKFLEKHA